MIAGLADSARWGGDLDISAAQDRLAIAVLALFTGLASAQVNIGGSAAGSLACTANVANPAQVRTEGYAELLGDIFCCEND